MSESIIQMRQGVTPVRSLSNTALEKTLPSGLLCCVPFRPCPQHSALRYYWKISVAAGKAWVVTKSTVSSIIKAHLSLHSEALRLFYWVIVHISHEQTNKFKVRTSAKLVWNLNQAGKKNSGKVSFLSHLLRTSVGSKGAKLQHVSLYDFRFVSMAVSNSETLTPEVKPNCSKWITQKTETLFCWQNMLWTHCKIACVSLLIQHFGASDFCLVSIAYWFSS